MATLRAAPAASNEWRAVITLGGVLIFETGLHAIFEAVKGIWSLNLQKILIIMQNTAF